MMNKKTYINGSIVLPDYVATFISNNKSYSPFESLFKLRENNFDSDECEKTSLWVFGNCIGTRISNERAQLLMTLLDVKDNTKIVPSSDYHVYMVPMQGLTTLLGLQQYLSYSNGHWFASSTIAAGDNDIKQIFTKEELSYSPVDLSINKPFEVGHNE